MTTPNDRGSDYVPDSEDQLQPNDSLVDRNVSDMLDEGYSPPEKPLAIDDDDELNLDERLAREESDVSEDSGADTHDPRSGRLVAPPQDPDSEEQRVLSASDVGIDGGAASAEEAAVHVIKEDEARERERRASEDSPRP